MNYVRSLEATTSGLPSDAIEFAQAAPPVISIGQYGHPETAEIAADRIPYIATPEGAIGMSRLALQELVEQMPEDGIAWFQVTPPHHSSQTSQSPETNRQSSTPETPQILSFFDERLQIDFDTFDIRVDGVAIKATRIEFGLLETLASSPRKVFTRTELMDITQGCDSIKTHISRLRPKLGVFSDCVKTRTGIGYYFESNPDEINDLRK